MGMAWSILSPLLTLFVMKLVFTQFFGRNTPHYMTYLFCGNLIFSYFNESTSQGMSSLMGNASIFTKVNIPKYLFLLSKHSDTHQFWSNTMRVFCFLCVRWNSFYVEICTANIPGGVFGVVQRRCGLDFISTLCVLSRYPVFMVGIYYAFDVYVRNFLYYRGLQS